MLAVKIEQARSPVAKFPSVGPGSTQPQATQSVAVDGHAMVETDALRLPEQRKLAAIAADQLAPGSVGTDGIDLVAGQAVLFGKVLKAVPVTAANAAIPGAAPQITILVESQMLRAQTGQTVDGVETPPGAPRVEPFIQPLIRLFVFYSNSSANPSKFATTASGGKGRSS